MRTTVKAALLAATLLFPLTACKEEVAGAAPPPPQAITADAVGHYCGMNLSEHNGPKGQVLLKGQQRPVWMSSVRDTFAFTMLPEEPKDYRAVYVTDMARAKDAAHPDFTAWVEARSAFYVVGSAQRGDMGAPEPMPFSEEAAAHAFAATQGGTVKRFAQVTEDEILQPTVAEDDPPPAQAVTAQDQDTHAGHDAHGGQHGGQHGGKAMP